MKTHIISALRTLHGILRQSISHPHKKHPSRKRTLIQHLENTHHVVASWMLASLVGVYAFLGTSLFLSVVEASSYVPSTLPSKVLNLKAQYASGIISLSWSPVVSENTEHPVSDYVIVYRTSTHTRYSIFSDGVSSRNSTKITRLTPGKKYDFRVAAKSKKGIGTFSNIVRINTANTTVIQDRGNTTPTSSTPKCTYKYISLTNPGKILAEGTIGVGESVTLRYIEKVQYYECKGVNGAECPKIDESGWQYGKYIHQCQTKTPTPTPPTTQTPPPTETPIDGSCGSVNGLTVSVAPTFNLCAKGIATEVKTLTDTFSWSCEGSAGGTRADCRALKANISSPTNPLPPAPVYTYAWSTGAWGTCSVSCGGGMTERTVTCKRNDGVTVSDTLCSISKPSVSQTCNTTACVIPVNGSCGTSINTPTSIYPTGSQACSEGTQSNSDAVGSDGTYNWICNGLNGGGGVSCSVSKISTVTISTGTSNPPPVGTTSRDGISKPIPNQTSYTWRYCSPLYTGNGCTFTGIHKVRMTDGITTSEPLLYMSSFPSWHCNASRFGISGNANMRCEVAVEQELGTLSTPTTAPMMDIDLSRIPLGLPGTNQIQIQPTTATVQDRGDGIGAFRTVCQYSHMSFNDPIVFPGQPGRAHLHTFFGNTYVDAYSTNESIRNTGNSTCPGGIGNRTAYWIPSLINTTNGAPIVPESAIWYYKSGYQGSPAASIRSMPPGLKMIAGNMHATASQQPYIYWQCHNKDYTTRTSTIPTDCDVGDDIDASIEFPSCWDGQNLDSQNHQSHMAYGNGGCPSSHPVALPVISLNIKYRVNQYGESSTWRLSSDHTGQPAGLSLHADWWNGWNQEVLDTWITNCINRGIDCHADLLGDGRQIY